MEPSTLTDHLRPACSDAFADEPVVAAYLHGSAASGRTGPFSDVDVALLLGEPCRDPLGEALRLGGMLARNTEVADLDVRVLNGAGLRTLKRYLDFEIHARERRSAFLEQVARGTSEEGSP